MYQVRRKEAELAASVAIGEGLPWEAVRGVRVRWRIEAQPQIPPPISTEAYYVPAKLAEEPQRGDAGYEGWLALLSEWNGELITLYKTVIPKDYRELVGRDMLNWLKFLSALVLYDPPIADHPGMAGLPEFCDALETSRHSLHLMAEDGSVVPDPEMVLGPFALVQDAREVEELLRERDKHLIAALQERGEPVPPFRDPERVRDDLLRNTPGLAEKLRALEEQIAPRRILTDHEREHSKKEVRAALDALLKARSEPSKNPKGGQDQQRDPARTAEVAILASRYGWTHRRVAELHGWLRDYDYSLATQWIADGKEIVSKLQERRD
jgi:hypothetical protein